MGLATKKIAYFLLVFSLSPAFFKGCSPQKPHSENPRADSSAARAQEISFQNMLANPYSDLKLSREEYKGKLLYERFCAVCHGETGDGNGFNAFNLQNSFQVKPFSFADSGAMASVTKMEIEKAIIGGGKAVGKSQYMPPWGSTLQPDEIQALIAFIYTFSQKPGVASQP